MSLVGQFAVKAVVAMLPLYMCNNYNNKGIPSQVFLFQLLCFPNGFVLYGHCFKYNCWCKHVGVKVLLNHSMGQPHKLMYTVHWLTGHLQYNTLCFSDY